MILDLLNREHGCWAVQPVEDPQDLSRMLSVDPPDLVVVDAADFPGCCDPSLGAFPSRRVVVIGLEPDAAYEDAALRGGAGAWLARDCIADELSSQMRLALAGVHEPHPPDRRVRSGG